jgi:hypothetical protein
MKKEQKERPLTEEEIDEIVIAQADDDDAWEEEIEVTPISRRSIKRNANPPNGPQPR